MEMKGGVYVTCYIVILYPCNMVGDRIEKMIRKYEEELRKEFDKKCKKLEEEE